MEQTQKPRAMLVFVGVLLVSLGFALGYLWSTGQAMAPIVIEKCSDA